VSRRPWLILALLLGAGCDQPAPDDGVRIGVLLSYSGHLAANSINSERALLMALEVANAAGGVGGRPVVTLARDTGSQPDKVIPPAQELAQAGVALFIGPDAAALAVQLKAVLENQTVILPSFTTVDSTIYKPHSWFVMGASPARVACELNAQLKADGRRQPMVLLDPDGYNYLVGRNLGLTYGATIAYLPTGEASHESTLLPITRARADAYVLATSPSAATSVIYAMAALSALGDPRAWYLSPTLHTPAFLDTIPKGMLQGAHGVATGTAAGAGEFRERFFQRWQDQPLDEAYSFYDAGAIAVLALQHALSREGAIPTGTGLARHLIAVTRASGTPVRWNELGRGLELLRAGQEVGYIGLSGPLEYDITGQTATANTNWWTIDGGAFADVASKSECR
jgi:ABC-type branched-subunit amino acid transport system substrate-binding protein